jgi:plasmid stabilization system protein ParE
VTPEAKAELRAIYLYLRERAPAAAIDWRKQARSEIKSLSRFPERCPIAPDREHFPDKIRQIFLGSGNRGTYRVLFIIVEKSVRVIHVRPGSMLPWKSDKG